MVLAADISRCGLIPVILLIIPVRPLPTTGILEVRLNNGLIADSTPFPTIGILDKPLAVTRKAVALPAIDENV